MTLFTKSILAPVSSDDGLRISVMSRHTLNDGITPHPDITNNLFDEWLQELSPRPGLVGAWYKRSLPWDDFEEAYLIFLRRDPQAEIVRSLATQAISHDFTIMCIEELPKHCHRRLLAEECHRVEPSLTIVVR